MSSFGWRNPLFVAVVVLSAGCVSAPSMANDCGASAAPSVSLATRAVADVLDDFHDAAAKADEARYFSHLADDAVFLGTDASERWSKAEFLAYAHPHFAKGKAWRFAAKSRHVALAGGLAYFDEELETEGLGPARGSGVLALRDGRYQILQYNLTITVPNERFDLVKEGAGESVVLQASAGHRFAELAWLSGSWAGRSADGAEFEEVWMPPRADGMLGMSRASKNGTTLFSERLALLADGAGISYRAFPSGQAETSFTLTEQGPSRLVFENAQHDYPKRIRYERVAKELVVTIDDGQGGRSASFRLTPAVVSRKLPK